MLQDVWGEVGGGRGTARVGGDGWIRDGREGWGGCEGIHGGARIRLSKEGVVAYGERRSGEDGGDGPLRERMVPTFSSERTGREWNYKGFHSIAWILF